MSKPNRVGNLARAAVEQAAGRTQDLGRMPAWNLADLYPSPTSKAVQADLKKAAE